MLNRSDIAKINAARTLLRSIEKELSGSQTATMKERPYAQGRLAEACQEAEYALFNVLVTAQTYELAEVTDEDVLNRPSS